MSVYSNVFERGCDRHAPQFWRLVTSDFSCRQVFKRRERSSNENSLDAASRAVSPMSLRS